VRVRRHLEKGEKGQPDITAFWHVLRFGIVSLFPMAFLAVLLTWSLDQQATASAIEEAKHATREAARTVVVPELPEGLLTGDPAAIAAMDGTVRDRVLNERVVRVKIWSPAGTILYSDEPRLIGNTFPLDPDDLDTLRTGVMTADLSDPTRPENRFERGYGQLLEVYLRIYTPSRQALLLEDCIRYETVTDRSRRLLLGLLPSMLGGLVLLELGLLPLAWQLARRVREGQRERLHLVQRAVDASDAERRRIAADLHDSAVQELAAVSYSLAATGRQLGSAGHAAAAAAVEEAARTTRLGVRQLRTLLVEIYPPDLHLDGLTLALRDLLATVSERGLRTELSMAPALPMDHEAERLIYRAAQEALRNVIAHAQATRADVSVDVVDSIAVLIVRDDGRGLPPGWDGLREPTRHFGLRLLSDLAHEAGGRLDVSSEEGRGTTVRLQVPTR
jgi:two-component system, NarL family, sensor kinase